MTLDEILEQIRNEPVAIYCPKFQQRAIISDIFDECNNPFRVDDDTFVYAIFIKDTVTFYQDSLGADVISFKELIKGFIPKNT